jgi:site-specific recombinase XerD
MLRDQWLRWAETKRQNSEETLRAYSREYDALEGYAETRGLEVSLLNARQLRQYLQYQGVSEKTAARRWSALNSFYQFLLTKTGERDDNPMGLIPRPKIPQGMPRAILDVEEKINRLNEPYRSIAQFIHETGMATSEMLSIDLDDEVRDAQVWVTGRKDRARPVILTPKAQAALRRIRRTLKDRKWLSARAIQKTLREKAELSPRGLRNTVAAELATNGADVSTVQAVLGHQSASSTRAYMDAFAKTPDSADVRRALERRGRFTAGDLKGAE